MKKRLLVMLLLLCLLLTALTARPAVSPEANAFATRVFAINKFGYGAGRLAWAALGEQDSWPAGDGGKVYQPVLPEPDRQQRRRQWAGEIARTRYQDGTR